MRTTSASPWPARRWCFLCSNDPHHIAFTTFVRSADPDLPLDKVPCRNALHNGRGSFRTDRRDCPDGARAVAGPVIRRSIRTWRILNAESRSVCDSHDHRGISVCCGRFGSHGVFHFPIPTSVTDPNSGGEKTHPCLYWRQNDFTLEWYSISLFHERKWPLAGRHAPLLH